MKYRKIGNSDLEVSFVSLGSWVFGGAEWGEACDAESTRVVEEAIDRGINLIDTAPVYGAGRSEEVIGRALQKSRCRAGKIVIATKCGLEQKGRSIRPNLSAGFIREEVENSLKRLNVEAIDLYQCHWPDKTTPLEETFGEMKRLLEQGKIKHIGVCNFDQKLLKEAVSIAPVVSDQVQYSLLERDIEKDLMPFCKENGVSILSYGSLGGGVLTGKYKSAPVFSKGDVRSFFYKYYKEPFWSKSRDVVSELESLARKHGQPISRAAIDWVLTKPEVASCIVGCRTTCQLRENISK
ncbi:MAG: aldo/keto reductase [Candidatus Omnitrophota bacterium]